MYGGILNQRYTENQYFILLLFIYLLIFYLYYNYIVLYYFIYSHNFNLPFY
jgi:hypothetical protein